MDLLQRLQIGRKLSARNVPPFDSGILCPTSKSKTVILFVHHVTKHFASYFSPTQFRQTCSRSALGIFALAFVTLIGDFGLPAIGTVLRTSECLCGGAYANGWIVGAIDFTG